MADDPGKQGKRPLQGARKRKSDDDTTHAGTKPEALRKELLEDPDFPSHVIGERHSD